MTHVGLCTQDGPEQRKGEIRIEMIGSAARLKATMRLDGAECSYVATLSDAYKGVMSCPDRPAMPLTLWGREAGRAPDAPPRLLNEIAHGAHGARTAPCAEARDERG